jgi:hypothetical protein
MPRPRVLPPAAAHEGPTRPPQVGLRTQEIVDVMSSDKKVFDFPKSEITSEEKARRAMAEAKRLAGAGRDSPAPSGDHHQDLQVHRAAP